MSLSMHRGAPVAARSPTAGLGSAAEARAAVEVSHLRKTYGATVAVDDVSFSVAEGEIFGILGPNGAGKSTTVECVIGLRTPDAGVIQVMALIRWWTARACTRSWECSCRPAPFPRS